MHIGAEIKSNKITYYWQLCNDYAVTMLRYIPEEKLGNLFSRIKSKRINIYSLHYHTKDRQPVYVKDDEDFSIFIVLHEDTYASKQGLVLYYCDHDYCSKSITSTI
jgi:hypothetical protein